MYICVFLTSKKLQLDVKVIKYNNMTSTWLSGWHIPASVQCQWLKSRSEVRRCNFIESNRQSYLTCFSTLIINCNHMVMDYEAGWSFTNKKTKILQNFSPDLSISLKITKHPWPFTDASSSTNWIKSREPELA